MSILKTTKSGYKYAKWHEEVEYFALRTLQVNSFFKENGKMKSARYLLPVRIQSGETLYSEDWFTYNTCWTQKEFVDNFIDHLRKKLNTVFELEDVIISSIVKIK